MSAESKAARWWEDKGDTKALDILMRSSEKKPITIDAADNTIIYFEKNNIFLKKNGNTITFKPCNINSKDDNKYKKSIITCFKDLFPVNDSDSDSFAGMVESWWKKQNDKIAALTELNGDDGVDFGKFIAVIGPVGDDENNIEYVLYAKIPGKTEEETQYFNIVNLGDPETNDAAISSINNTFGIISGGKRKSRRTRKGKSKNKKRRTNRRRR